MINIGITSSPRPVLEMLQRLQVGLNDMEPVLLGIGQKLESRISARFETETDPEGNAWAPWSPSTEAGYPQRGNRRILDRYGDMIHSMGHQLEGDAVLVGFGAVASKKRDVYAIYHEWGTKTMPRRGLLTADPVTGTLSQGDVDAVLDIMQVWLQDL